jgi:hypothetical protein
VAHFRDSLIFASRAGAYLGVAQHSAPLYEEYTDLPENIRQAYKNLVRVKH